MNDDDEWDVDANMAADTNQYMFSSMVEHVNANQQDLMDKEKSPSQKPNKESISQDQANKDSQQQVEKQEIQQKEITVQQQSETSSKSSQSFNQSQVLQYSQVQQQQTLRLAKNLEDGIDLRNINNQQYVGDIALGSPPQVLTVMFDTGSSIMYALSSKCKKGCPQRLEKFDPEQSATFVDYGDKRQDQNYGKGFVTGGLALDQLCFTQDTEKCQSIKFLQVDGGNDLQQDQFSGIIGLAPQSSEEKSVTPAFVGQIGKMFSFYFSKGSGSVGNLKIGGYNLEKYAKKGSTPQDIIWASVIDDGWTIPFNGLRFQNGNAIELKSEQITLDTGLSYALVPPRDIDEISKSLKNIANFTCKKQGYSDLDMYECDCTKAQYNRLKPLQIAINNKYFTLPVDAWMSFNDQEERNKCKILMHPYDISMTATYKWVVGLQFLQNFYSIFDVEGKRVGLIESKDA